MQASLLRTISYLPSYHHSLALTMRACHRILTQKVHMPRTSGTILILPAFKGTNYSHIYHNIFMICTSNLSISFTMNADYSLLDIILASHHELRYEPNLALHNQHAFLVIKSIVTEIYNFLFPATVGLSEAGKRGSYTLTIYTPFDQ